MNRKIFKPVSLAPCSIACLQDKEVKRTKDLRRKPFQYPKPLSEGKNIQSLSFLKEKPPTSDENILTALDDPAEREALVEEQRKIMQQIEKQKKENDASIKAAQTLAYNQRIQNNERQKNDNHEYNKEATVSEVTQPRLSNSVSVGVISASCRTLEYIDGTPMQNKLSFTEISVDNNGSIMTNTKKRALREKLGYCLECRDLPTLLYKIKKNKFNPFKTTKEARAVAELCAGGICFICHPEKDPSTRYKRRSFRIQPSPTPPPPGRKTARASSTRMIEGSNY